MQKKINSKIAGISLHQNVVSEVVPGEELVLEREKTNPFDDKAIKILHGNKQLGYIRKALAAEISEVIDSGVEVRCFATAITGEGYNTRGINIEIRVGASA